MRLVVKDASPYGDIMVVVGELALASQVVPAGPDQAGEPLGPLIGCRAGLMITRRMPTYLNTRGASARFWPASAQLRKASANVCQPFACTPPETSVGF